MPKYLNAREAAAYIPGRPHFNSIRRWMSSGCYGVILRSVRFGGKRLTRDDWVQEFCDAVAARMQQPSEHFKAEATLDRLGVSLKTTRRCK